MKIELERPSICGCLLDFSPEEIAGHMVETKVDLLEWRLDMFIRRYSLQDAVQAVSLLANERSIPFLVTNRPAREGGAFEGRESLRLEVLRKAVEAGAEYVDLETDVSDSDLKWFKTKQAGVVLSHHDFNGTPDERSLRKRVEQMAGREPDVVKIVSLAREHEDNLTMLGLIPWARKELGARVIAFCMGQAGRWSRVICVAMGSPWTYVQLPGQNQAAPGQFSADDMRIILKTMGVIHDKARSK